MSNQDITINLYAGKHQGKFSAGSHRYKIDDKYKKGVTTVIGATLAKPGLAMWPLTQGLKSLGCIYDEVNDKWGFANSEQDLIVSLDMLNKAAKASTYKRDAGANTGTEAHALVEQLLRAEIRGEQPSLPNEISHEARNAYMAFLGWYSGLNNADVIGVERVVFSEEFDYAGTFDSILKINGKVYLCDLKTTNASRTAPEGVYPEAFLQLGAYYQAYQEEREYLKDRMDGSAWERTYPKIDDVMIISAKKDGRLHIKTGADVGIKPEQCAQLWLKIWDLYSNMQSLSATLAGKH